MRRATLISLVFAGTVVLVFAGCLGGGSEGSSVDANASHGEAPSSSGIETTVSTNVTASASEANATLEEAPSWKIGEWWTAEVAVSSENSGADVPGETRTVTSVVTGRHGDTYHVGLAAESFSDAAVLVNWPPLGEIGTDLTWSVHNAEFDPLRFPLEEGKSWETTYYGSEGATAEVLTVDETEATVRLSPGDDNVTYTYDAVEETITRFSVENETLYEVTGHGTGFEGEVLVPHGRTMDIRVRLAGAFDPSSGDGSLPYGPPSSPHGTLEVSQPEASLGLWAGGLPVQGASAPGIYRETATDPGGEAFQVQSVGTGDWQVAFGHAAEAAGTWQFEHVAAGPGIVGTEIVAYEQLNVTVGGDDPGESP